MRERDGAFFTRQGEGADCGHDAYTNLLRSVDYFGVCKTQHSESFGRQPACPAIVVVDSDRMTRPVEFDDQPGLSTVEIDDTQPNWLLPPKTDAKLPSAQDLPKVALGRRGIGAQDTGAREQQFNVVGWLLSHSPSPRRVKNTPPSPSRGEGKSLAETTPTPPPS